MSPGRSQLFRASWDSMTEMISASVAVLLLTPVLAVHNPVTIVLAPLVLLAAYAWSPQSYEIRDRTLIIKRLAGNVRVPLDTIRQARAASADDLTGCVRLFGSGGLFGWYGLFRTARLGKSTWYMTDRQNAVVLVTDRKTLLVSPDEVERFVNAIGLEAPPPAITDNVLNALGTYEGGNSGAIIGGVVAVVGLIAVALTFFYSPGPPGYTLTQNALTIHDRFYPVTVRASSVDVSAIRVVDITKDKAWQPTMRTNGFGSPHYHAGWFRVESGKKVRMYRADGKQLVLLPPSGEGNAVLFETRDPAQFVRKIREEWSERSSARLNRPE
jgi:hypothetical protein